MVRFRIILLLVAMLSMQACEDFFNPDTSTPAEKLKGTWQVVENSIEFGEQQYLVEFYQESNDSATVKIYNFFGLGSWSFVMADVDNQTILIPTQTEEGYQIVGSGSINSDFTEIEMNFTVEEVVVPQKNLFAVTAVLTKQ
jgi:hypothetical protein